MAITETVTKESVSLNLNNGTDSEGQIKVVKTSFPTLNANLWNGDKVMAVISKIEPCLSKTVYSVSHVRTALMSE